MPSLVKYAHEILSEDRYGYRALEKVDERIASLNDAQLVGMISHLSGSMSRARSRLWRYANSTVLETVKDEFEIREEEHRMAEQRDWMENREERERAEMDQMRAAEKAAAEKQIMRTAEREAREDVEKTLQDFRTQTRIKLMLDTYRARNIRQYTWTFALLVLIGMSVSVKIIEDNKTVAFSEDAFLIGLIGSILVVCNFGIGWRWGEAKEQSKTEAEIADMIEERKQEKLVEFHERDRKIRAEIAMQDEIDLREKEARMQARKAEKKRLRRIEKERKTAHNKKQSDAAAKRKMLFLKGTGDGEKKDGEGDGKSPGLLSIAASAALKAVEDMEPGGPSIEKDKMMDNMEKGLSGGSESSSRPETPMTKEELLVEESARLKLDIQDEAMALENRRRTEDVKASVKSFGAKIRGKGNRAVIVPTKGGSGGGLRGILEDAADLEGMGGKRKTEGVEEAEELLDEGRGGGGEGGEGGEGGREREKEEVVEVKIKKKKAAGFRRESQGMVQVMGEGK